MKSIEEMHILLVGSTGFNKRITAIVNTLSKKPYLIKSYFANAREKTLEERPDIIFLEIGFGYSEHTHSWVRDFLTFVKKRLKNKVFVVLIVLDPTKLYYAGDLLFQEDSLSPSCLVHTFLIQPPSLLLVLPNLNQQIENVLNSLLLYLEHNGSLPPYLGEGNWVDSLADPKSRELWMIWLPRYSSYINENPIITGETGAGKTKLAKAIHYLSQRQGRFVSITPRDFSSSELVQAELFGAVAGAYTGAIDKWGLVKEADNGSLFIDELQSIDKELQGKLITFIENKIYRRVGSSETVKANVRFIFATNQPIKKLVEQDILREDFAYRLERLELFIPPLRERRLDIAAATSFALAKIQRQRKFKNIISGLTTTAFAQILSQTWKGNLRQLENTIAKLIEYADLKNSPLITKDILINTTKESEIFFDLKDCLLETSKSFNEVVSKRSPKNLEEASNIFKETAISVVLSHYGGDIDKASTVLGEESALLSSQSQSILAKNEKLN